jgi:hypothetical protein
LKQNTLALLLADEAESAFDFGTSSSSNSSNSNSSSGNLDFSLPHLEPYSQNFIFVTQ